MAEFLMNRSDWIFKDGKRIYDKCNLLSLCGPATPKPVFWQTVKTQMKCCISSDVALFGQTKSIDRERNTILFWNLLPVTPQYIQWTILALLYEVL